MPSARILAFLFFSVLLPAGWAPPAWGGLGPRRDMRTTDYARLTPAMWSDFLEIKFSDARDVKLENGRILDASTGRVLLDASQLPAAVQPAALMPTFSTPPALLRAQRLALMKKCNCELGKKENYFRLKLAGNYNEKFALLKQLNAMDIVEVAYPVPLPVPPPADIPPATPDYSAQQRYFSQAPNGIGVWMVNFLPGARGEGVTIFDVEYNWHVQHEDLEACVNALVPDAGTLYTQEDFVAHGTAVLGILFGGGNGYGVTGSLVRGTCRFAPSYTYEYGYNVARGIDLAHSHATTRPAAILLEAQEAGPNFNPDTYGGMVPVEYIPATYDAIRAAVADGIVVVEAGANGWENLDAPVYGDTFNRAVADSGAILVGAGTPPDNAPARRREWYSNWGSRMDVQGWGSYVVTSGYGDLFAPDADNRQYYTTQFGGTSSASPIVTSAVGVLLGVHRASPGTACSRQQDCASQETCDTTNFTPGRCVRTQPPDPLFIRRILTETGTPQTGDTSEHIGPLPNLALAVEAVIAVCGNGQLETGEACDDGNTTAGDGCSADCRSNETCGNGIVDAAAGEACDDGNTTAGDGCSADCRSNETCGNGIVDAAAGETCDDGNTTPQDGCSADCRSDETCGNGFVDPWETCDDGNTTAGDGCSADCRSNETCGNGYRDVNEECEDGNTLDGDGCSATCRSERKKKDGCGCTTGTRQPDSTLSLLLVLLPLLVLVRSRRRRF